jgi:aminoglycoside phosphotransferase (APT) family kinase protein
MPAWTGSLSVEQFPHGHSNLTYLLRIGDTEMVLRRPPFGNQVKTAHDMSREFRVLSRLGPVFPLAPRPFFLCEDETVLGAPFYVMERRHGVILRKSVPAGVVLDADLARRLGLTLIDTLASLHGLDAVAVGLADLGKPEGYVARQVQGWSKRYDQSRTDDLPEMERAAKWLADHLPTECGAAIVHNDFKYDNLVLAADDPTRVVAVLDWEMTTLGDPWMDLGTTLAYWVEATDPPDFRAVATGPTYLPGSPIRRDLVERYQERTGRAVPNVVFYYVFGLFKVAVIVQQIYARFVRGHTHDARFGRLNEWVATLARQADRALATGQL